MNMGNKIREARKKHGLSMNELASRVGVSYLTIHRVETDKVSPSVALLSDIAHHLGEPLLNFFEKENTLLLVRSGKAPKIKSGKMTLDLLIPKGVINDRISVALGTISAGDYVSEHAHTGFEMTYHLKGEALFKYGDQEYELKKGDLIYFDAKIEHSVVALTTHKFLSVYFRENE
jgi:transcriptional regulator with XRE-family HTH domain